MESKKPWLVEGNPWGNESKFITWVRGVLRKGWGVHPLKITYKNARKIKVKNLNPRSMKAHPEVFKIQCEKCLSLVSPGEIEIDHKGDYQGRFTCMEEIEGYARHLYMIDESSIQCVCKTCHKAISHSQKLGVSFEEAVLLKEVIRIDKEESVEDIIAFCQDYEYNDNSTKKKRKENVEAILRSVN